MPAVLRNFSATHGVIAGGLIAAVAALAVLAPSSEAGKLPGCGPYNVKDLGKRPGEIFQGEVNSTREFIRGTGKNDLITGGGGEDVIDGGGGDDIICGDAGDDIITGNKGDDIIIGGGDDDKLRGDSGKDTVQGKGGDDECLFNSEDKISSCDKADEVRVPDFPF
jgi:hypothetical protein